MQKIFNYIIKGQGLGVKFILLASVIISFIFALFIRINGAELVPYANDIVNQMLPLKIENGVVVEPHHTIRVAQLRSGDVAIPLPIVMDTTIDTLNTEHAERGFYLTKTAFYAVNDHEVRMYQLEGDVDLRPGDYTDDIKSVLTWTAVSMFFIGILFIFVTYFIGAIFYALCAQILGLILGKKYNFDVRMRLSVICFLAVYIFYFLLSLCGLESGKLIFFITTLVLQSVFIYKLPLIKEEVITETAKTAVWPAEISETPAEEKVVQPKEASKQEPKAKAEKKPVKKEAKASKATSAKPTKKTTVSKKAPAKKTPAKKTPAKKKAEK